MVMTHTHAEGQGQRSVGSKDRLKQMDGQMDKHKDDCIPPALMRSVITCSTQLFYGSLDSVWDKLGEPVPEVTITENNIQNKQRNMCIN